MSLIYGKTGIHPHTTKSDAKSSILPNHNTAHIRAEEAEGKEEKYMGVRGKISFNGLGPSKEAIDGLDFILTHFQEPLFPRTISTKLTEGRQILVFNKEEVRAKFKESDFLDCRINAYPSYTGFSGINRQAPNFIFIDLDRSTFKTERAHKLALTTTLKTIKENLGSEPTVLWTGNGYHIYQPVDAFVLEQEEIFSKFNQPSTKFLKFAEQALSNHKSDPLHNPSFKSCMIRIPGSHNSKCILKGMDSQIKILQKWDGIRPSIKGEVLYEFYLWLAYEKIKDLQRQKEAAKNRKKAGKSHTYSGDCSIRWIEKLLQTPIEDYRKNAVGLILAPYLITLKGLSYEYAFEILKEWLNKCASVRSLDFNSSYRVRCDLNNAMKSRIPPMKPDTLKNRNRPLYDKVCT